MMNLKSHNISRGLSLIEVMATLALLSFIILALSSLQGGLMRSAVKTRDRVNRIIAMKNFLQKAHYEEWKRGEVHEKTEEGLHITYEQSLLTEDSLLKKYKDIVIEKVTVTWQGLLGEQKDQLINFLYIVPPEEKPEKEKSEEKKE